MERPHVVVIGAGFGGLAVARSLRRAEVRVTVIDSNNFHTFQPLLYQVASAGLAADDVCFPVRGILRRNPASTFVLGTVTGIDLDGRNVTIDGSTRIAYDHLVIAAGSVSASFGVPGVDEHTFGLKSLDDALAIRAHLLRRFEHASAQMISGSGGGPVDLGIVIVGGGPTGVELAGGLRELIDHVLSKDFPGLGAERTPVTLVEGADRLLGPFHPSSSKHAAETLADRAVTVLTGTGVERVEHGAVVLRDGRRIEGGTVVWAAGVTASPVASLLGIELARGGRIPVEADLSLAGHPEVFAIGDIAASPTDDGRPLPQVAQPAIQGGVHGLRRSWPASLAGPPSRSTIATRGRWPPSAATGRWPNWPTGGGSTASSVG